MGLNILNMLRRPFKGSIWTIKQGKYHNNLTNEYFNSFPAHIPMEFKPINPTNLGELLHYDSVDHNASLEGFHTLYKDTMFYKSEESPTQIFMNHIKLKKEEFNSLLNDMKNTNIYDKLLKINRIKFILDKEVLNEIHSHTHLLVVLEIIQDNLSKYLISQRIGLLCYDISVRTKTGEYTNQVYRMKQEAKKYFMKLKHSRNNVIPKLSELCLRSNYFDELIIINKELLIKAYEEVFVEKEDTKSEGEI